MKQNPYYILRELSGVPYLLPYGQLIVDHRHSVRLNSTGAYYWNLLSTEHSVEELIAYGQQFFQIQVEDYKNFQQETSAFLNRLCALGILIDDSHKPTASGSDTQYLTIAGIPLKLVGRREFFPEAFDAFLCTESREAQQTIEFCTETPPTCFRGQLLLHNSELTILEADGEYIIHFPSSPQLLQIHLNEEGTHARLYCAPPFSDEYKYAIFHAIRLVFLYLAQRRGMIVLHSASLLYQGKAWLFSAPSGTGKTTHTNLWKKLFHTPILNGDLNLLALQDAQPVVHGIPWCGTSETFTTHTHPLGGIVLLNRAPKDSITELSPDQKELLVNLRLISPTWTQEMLDLNIHATRIITNGLPLCQLNCTKEASAATTMKAWIDARLSQSL